MSGQQSKADIIRKVLEKHPRLDARAIHRILNTQWGISVSYPHVYSVQSKWLAVQPPPSYKSALDMMDVSKTDKAEPEPKMVAASWKDNANSNGHVSIEDVSVLLGECEKVGGVPKVIGLLKQIQGEGN